MSEQRLSIDNLCCLTRFLRGNSCLAWLSQKYKVMESEYLDPADERQGNDRNNQTKKGNLERKGPATAKKGATNSGKKNKVLHDDGSLADLPYNNNPGSGALEGTVGIGS